MDHRWWLRPLNRTFEQKEHHHNQILPMINLWSCKRNRVKWNLPVPPMVTRMQGQMYFYAVCRCSKTHSGFAHKAAGPLAATGGAGTSGGRRTVEACFSDTERRLCPEKHKKHAHVCVCLSTNRHSHTHTSLMRAPYIIFVHNLICLSPAVYCAMVTGPTPGPPPPPRCRHTFLWFAAWLQQQQPASCSSAATHKKNEGRRRRRKKNEGKRRRRRRSAVWSHPSGSECDRTLHASYKVSLRRKPVLFHQVADAYHLPQLLIFFWMI